MPRSLLLTLALAACSAPRPRPLPAATNGVTAPIPGALALDQLGPGQHVHGFATEAVYVDDAGHRLGGRFRHARTGFLLDLLAIESAPQAFIWVNSLPSSDRGEPHTQEHLLLGKGRKGRAVATRQDMSLVSSSAFTAQRRTAYHLHTVAGPEVFFDVLGDQLDGLLSPDYSDEEIRREVRHFGVSPDPVTGALSLEEKGTVYNEMVASFDRPNHRLWRRLGQLGYGERHPLALSSGGTPDAIRTMSPADIRAFDTARYRLENMGAIVALPEAVGADAPLARIDDMLGQLAGDAPPAASVAVQVPPPSPAPAGTVEVVPYPHANPQQPGDIALAWPPTRALDVDDEVLLTVFLDSLAGDETTPLYRALIDSETRTLDTGATGLWSYVELDPGLPVYIGVSDARAALLSEDGARQVRDHVHEAILAIAALPAGDPALAAFNAHVRSRLGLTRRWLAKLVNAPPGFGYRDTGDAWLERLERLERAGGFERSLTLAPTLARLDAALTPDANPWAAAIERWGLDVEPVAVATRADPALLAEQAAARQSRLRAETRRLQDLYGVANASEALARYRSDDAAATAELERAGDSPIPPFVNAPPLTLDDGLRYATEAIDGVPVLRARFPGYTGAAVGVALDLRGVPEQGLVYLAALAPLLTEVGVVGDDGAPIAYDEVTRRLRDEVLWVQASIAGAPRSGRVELVLSGAGSTHAEAARSQAWMRRLLLQADWRPANLPRIRDVLDQRATALATVMQGAEESWVTTPTVAIRVQDDPVLMRAESFLTRAHDAHRLRWRFRAAPEGAAGVALDRLLRALADAAPVGRAGLSALAGSAPRSWPRRASAARRAYAGLTSPARALADEARRDLGRLLEDLPDDSLERDWRYLCQQIRADLAVPPATALAELRAVRDAVARRGGARAWVTAAAEGHEATVESLRALVTALAPGRAPAPTRTARRRIDERLRERVPTATAPRVYALVNRNTQGAVVHTLVSGASYAEREQEALLRYLASNLFTGGGAHGLFMRTWGAGLAYSNGFRCTPEVGECVYYAERSPGLAQTLSFVGGELRDARVDGGRVDYALAQAFPSRLAAGFEARTSAMADDLADGVTPAVVRGFRQAVLALVDERGDALADALAARIEAAYGPAVPGFGAHPGPDGVYFTVGPEPQLAAYEAFLRAVEDPDTVLYRLYPRDFWAVDPAP